MKKLILLLLVLQFADIQLSHGQTYAYVPDSTFNSDGLKTFTYFNNIDRLYGCALQADDKLVTAGLSKNTASSSFVLAVSRFLTNGDPDTSFGTANGTIYIPLGQLGSIGGQTPKVQIAPDGKIVAAASSMGNGTSNDMFVCRLDSTGTLDPTFHSSGTLSFDMTGLANLPDMVNALDIDSNGTIWLAGVTRNGSSPLNNDFAVAKVKSDGTLDISFDTDGKKLFNITGIAEFARSIKIDQNGKLVIAGVSGTNLLVFRIDSTGVLDPSFNTTGYNSFTFGSGSDLADMDIDSNNAIVVVGQVGSSSSSFAVARLTSAGILDNTFGTGGKFTATITGYSCTATSIHIQNDNRIIAGGYADITGQGSNFIAARVTDAGALDLTFNGTGYVQTPIITGAVDELGNGMAVMNDGRILMTGTIVYSSAVNEDCGMLRWKPVLQTTGMDEANAEVSLRALPNPFMNELQVYSQKEGILTISDVNGRNILQQSICAGQTLINTTEFPSGMYFVQVNGQRALQLIRQ
ncbi:MAG: T9SS type A sorting domain-containing protein [Bacteroidia bacterium]